MSTKPDTTAVPADAATLRAVADHMATLSEPIAARLRALAAKVAEFPRTADGVTVFPDTTVYCPSGHPIRVTAFGQKSGACNHEDCWDATIGAKHYVRYELSRCFAVFPAPASQA